MPVSSKIFEAGVQRMFVHLSTWSRGKSAG